MEQQSQSLEKASASWLYSPFLLAPLLLILEVTFVAALKFLLPAQLSSNVLLQIVAGILFWVVLYLIAKRMPFFEKLLNSRNYSGPSVNIIAHLFPIAFIVVTAALVIEFYQFSFLSIFYVLFFSMYPIYFFIGRIQAELKLKAQLDQSQRIAGGN